MLEETYLGCVLKKSQRLLSSDFYWFYFSHFVLNLFVTVRGSVTRTSISEMFNILCYGWLHKPRKTFALFVINANNSKTRNTKYFIHKIVHSYENSRCWKPLAFWIIFVKWCVSVPIINTYVYSEIEGYKLIHMLCSCILLYFKKYYQSHNLDTSES